MIKIFRNLFFSTLFILSSAPLFASHVAGGNIAYQCTGIPNQFIFTLTAYRDCSSGAQLGANQNLVTTNDCGFTLPTPIVLTRTETVEVSQICTAELPNTSCNGGNLSGVEKQTFVGIYTLPDTCDSWTFSWSACNRNTSVNLDNGDSECFFIRTTLNSGTQACNNSPTINAQPIPYVCDAQNVTYDYGVLEPDGDSLTFEFIAAMDNSGDPITYVPPYTPAQPIPGIAIDFNTGQITFNYTITGNFVVAVLIKEYNQCAELVGTMVHDIQFVIENCTNQVPQVVANPNVITNFNNFGTQAQLIGDNQIKLCTGDQFCFDISFDDVDPGTTVQLSSNVTNFLPGATFVMTPGNPATATICWTYTQGYTGSIISINATDDECPVPGFANYVVDLDVPPAVFPGEDSTFLLCGDEGVINLFDYLGGFFQINGEWQDPDGDSISNFQDVANMDPGIYTYIVYPDTGTASLCGILPNPCVESDSAFLTIGIGNLEVFFDPSNVINESCNDMFDGQASIGPITGNLGPFIVNWVSPYNGVHATQTVNNGGFASNDTLYQDEAGANPWTVTVTDQNGCTWVQQFQILEGSMNIVPTFSSPNCFGESNGSLTVENLPPGGGTPIVTDFYITNIAGDTLNANPAINTINLIPAGTYIVYATDALGCATANQFTVPPPFPGPIAATFNTIDPDCHQTAEGIIVITSVINTNDDMDDLEYFWDPLPPGNSNGIGETSLINCLPRDYSVTINDNSTGCSETLIITINDKDPLTSNAYVASDTYCRTSASQSGNGVVAAENVPDSSGTGSVNYKWVHLVTNAESNNSTFVVKAPGLVQLTVTDGLGCSFVDTVYVDSINPVANFEITSDQFLTAGVYEGIEDVKIKITNLSTGFAQLGNPQSDTLFQWNLNTTNVNDQDYWFFTKQLNAKPDTTYTAFFDNEATIYQVCLKVQNFNDCEDSLCQDVIVNKRPEFIAPNVFTPGTIPNNEFYFPAAGFPEFQAIVFNRYGVPVFEFNSITDKWNGNHYKTDKPCVDGVYNYTYKGVDLSGEVIEGTGQVHLIRHKP